MTRDEILQKVAETIRETFGVDDIEISNDTIADDIPGWDSLSHTIFMLTIEQTFGVELTSSTTFKDVGELVGVLSALIDR